MIFILTVRAYLENIFVVSRDQQNVRKRTVIRRIFGIRGRTADLSYTKSCGRYLVEILTNKANIII